jgi:biopolymer transport protein ExbD
MARSRFADEGFHFVLPITPMLDFTFQLLFFFMIYYNPSALEGQIEMNLPAPSDYKAKDTEPTSVNQNDVPTLPADITVVLRTQNDGSNNGLLKHISVKSRNGEETMADLPALKQYLESAKSTLENKEDIKIEADSRLLWFEVVTVVDTCKKAGFKIGFGQPPDLTVAP